MQTTNCYYYSNDVDVQLNIDPTLKLRNRPVYQRTLKIYHGIDNTIRFSFKNGDQQRVNITGFAVTFNLISGPEGSLIVSKPATIIDAPGGVVTVTLTELDLIDLRSQYYSYSLSVTDVDTSEELIVYSGTDYNVRGEVMLLAGHYPMFKPSVVVDLPAPTRIDIAAGTNIFVTTTGVVKADSPTRQQSSHHTVQFYPVNFTGKIVVQTTLSSLPNAAAWADEATLYFTKQTNPTYYNWDGVFAGIRFVITPDQIDPLAVPPLPLDYNGSIRKILYRA